jgi:hypothetical protein
MTEPRQAWDQVGNHLSGLGVKLKQHLDQELNDDDEEAVTSALKRLGDAIEETVDALGHAVKDPAVQQDVKSFGRSFVEALSVTMETASDKVRDVVEKRKAADGATPPPPGPASDGPIPPTPTVGDEPQAADNLED